MPNTADELAKNIARNVVPLQGGEAIRGPYEKMEGGILNLLRQLGILGGSAQPYTPQINEPLPQKDPITGQMVYPQGYRGPRG